MILYINIKKLTNYLNIKNPGLFWGYIFLVNTPTFPKFIQVLNPSIKNARSYVPF